MPAEWSKRVIDLNVEKLSDEDLAWADFLCRRQFYRQQKVSHATAVAGPD